MTIEASMEANMEGKQVFDISQYLAYLRQAQNNELLIDLVEKQYLTEELFMVLVSQSGLNLKFLPYRKRTKRLCRLAVINDARALEFVPEKLITRKLCLRAVIHGCEFAKLIPKNLLNDEMYLAAIGHYSQDFSALEGQFVSQKFCEKAVKQNPFALRCIPDEHINLKMCLDAVCTDAEVWDDVPKRFKNERFVAEVVLRQIKSIGVEDRYSVKRLMHGMDWFSFDALVGKGD